MTLSDAAQQRFVTLSATAGELGGCETQGELFRVMGRRLHELGLQTLVLMRTPDGRALRMTYVVAEDFFPESLAKLEERLGRRWFDVAFPCERR